MKIFCFMHSGKAITEEIANILFENAHDMLECRQTRQLIQYGKKYDGIIESTLEPTEFNGFEIVQFTAELVFQPVGYTKIYYGVRATDLERMHHAQWKEAI